VRREFQSKKVGGTCPFVEKCGETPSARVPAPLHPCFKDVFPSSARCTWSSSWWCVGLFGESSTSSRHVPDTAHRGDIQQRRTDLRLRTSIPSRPSETHRHWVGSGTGVKAESRSDTSSLMNLKRARSEPVSSVTLVRLYTHPFNGPFPGLPR